MSNFDKKSNCYRELESLARRCSLQLLPLNGKGRQPLALLLLTEGTDGRELAEAISGLDPAKGHHSQTKGRSCRPGDREQFDRRLALELERTRNTRLPCALLLLGGSESTDGGALAAQIKAAIEDCLHPPDILAPLSTGTLGLILPGVNACKARKRAEEILDLLQPHDSQAAVGIAVCHAYEAIAASELLALALSELDQAKKDGKGGICHAAARWQEDSCQVTVEERAQLFSFLQKETCP